MPVLIRQATAADLDDIVRLLADDVLGRQREAYSQPLPAGYVRAFAEIDRDANQRLVVITRAGTVVGTLHYTRLPSLTYQGQPRAQIEAVRIDRRFRGLGLGRQLFEWAIAEAKRAGCRWLQLTTNKARPEAVRFYEQLGFRATHEGLKLDLTQGS